MRGYVVSEHLNWSQLYRGDGGGRYALPQRPINYIDTKAKYRHLKKLTCKGTLRKVFISLRPRTPYPLSYTLYTCIQYIYSHREGGVGELNLREGERLTLSPVYKL